MQRNTLNSAIDKYYLGGLIESARWVIKKNSVSIAFISPNKDAIGRVECSGVELEDSKFGIYSTSQLVKLIKILDKTIELKLNKRGTVPLELLIADNQYDLSFYLSDPNLIDESPSVDLPTSPPVLNLDIDSSFVTKFVTAKKALGEIKQFTLSSKKEKPLMVIGEKSAYSNKVKFEIDGKSERNFDPIPFDVNFFTEMLLANKEDKGKIVVYEEGLMHVEFKSEESISTYFLVRLQES